MENKLTIIVPCYNEEAVLEDTTLKLTNYLNNLISKRKISSDSQILFINDGSGDKTQDIIDKHINDNIACIKLTNNFGHQQALMAGLNNVHSSFVVTIDADLQDDYSVIEQMIDKSKEGFDIVYGVRNKRNTDTFLKKTTAELFYCFMNLIGIKLVNNHADFRLLNAKAVNYIKAYHEKTVFLRGIIPLIGLKSTKVYYERQKRKKGKSKYSLAKMFSFAIDGIFGFSSFPLKFIFSISILMFLFSMFLLFFTIFNFSFKTLIIFILVFSNGLIVLSISIIGEYIYKIYIETKNRPSYLIDEIINLK